MRKGHANKPQYSVWYRSSFTTPSFTTPSLAHNFVTHHLLPHHLSHTAFSHTTFHTQLCHRFLSHTTFTRTIFHTKLCHIHHFLCRRPSFTHNFVGFVTHTLFLRQTQSFIYTALSHTTLHIQLVLLFGPPPPPLSFLPSPSPLQHLLLIIGRS